MLQTKIADAADKKSRSATTPKMTRAGDLRRSEFFVQHGRLFGPVVLGSRQHNTNDFTFTTVEDHVLIDPKIDSGLEIDENGKNLAVIQNKLSTALIGGNSVHLHIWEDSFGKFDSLRIALEESGLSYAVIPWEPADRLTFTDSAQERWEQK